MKNDTAKSANGKPKWPYPEFRLGAHANGQWCKKIKGVFRYFGPWRDPHGALQRYLRERATLEAGRTPKPDGSELTMKELLNAHLTAKQRQADTGEITRQSFRDQKWACDRFFEFFGASRLVDDIEPDDWGRLRAELAAKYGEGTMLLNLVRRARMVMNWGLKNGRITKSPMYGDQFKRPSPANRRKDREARPVKMFSRDEILALLGGASRQLKAALLLGINCGFGPADCADLPLKAVDLDKGLIVFPRPKTGASRMAVLWPETVQALREVLAHRKEPKDPADAGAFFIGKKGEAFSSDGQSNAFGQACRKLQKKLGIVRKGVSFYALRHVFRTHADEVGDRPAVDLIMGHVDPSMGAHYTHGISVDRLRKVTDHVHNWLFPPVQDVDDWRAD